MSRTLVIGDIHGNIKALKQCLERSEFDYNRDKLIVLGDVCDGFPYVKECINELLKIKNITLILGNHDLWALEWYDRPNFGVYTEETPDPWWKNQGGLETILSYNNEQMDKEHINFLRNAFPHYEKDGNIFVHGGFYEDGDISHQPLNVLIWDRGLFHKACMMHESNPNYKFSKYKNIFIGHTTTQLYHKKQFEKKGIYLGYDDERCCKPVFVCNVINLDTGAGWDGKLTIMDVNTKKHWQSDLNSNLYGKDKK